MGEIHFEGREKVGMETKSVGRMYQVFCEMTLKYYGKPRFYLMDLLSDLKQTGNDEYKADHDFPVRLYAKLSDAVVECFWNRFAGFSNEMIKPYFSTLWKFHKKYLTLVEQQSGDVMDAMVAEAGDLVRQCKEKIPGAPTTEVLHAIMSDISAMQEGGENGR